jgi:hypothetical protein
MSTLKPNSKNDIQAVFLDIRRELACAEGHFQAYDEIYQARVKRRPELTPFYDFFEITMLGHLAGMILSTTRVLDRDNAAATVLWLLRQIESQPDRVPGKANTVTVIKERLTRADPLVQKVRRIRNKKIAHLERMSKTQSKSFWEAIALAESDMKQLLSLLKGIMDDIEEIIWPGSGCGHMFAVEHETRDLLKALRFALANGCPIEGIEPSSLERIREEAATGDVADETSGTVPT